MYRKVESGLRMTGNEASERFPDSFILMSRDSRDFDPSGIILYTGDNYDELFEIMVDSEIPLGLVVEGLHRQCTLGGVVVGG